MLARLAARSVWHWQGLLLWLLQRPRLRGYPLPWPGSETMEQYLKQPRTRPSRSGTSILTHGVFAELMELRNKMGFGEAFLEDERVTLALQIARSKPGTLLRAKAAARQESLSAAKEKAAEGRLNFNPAAAQLLGPKGGLPRRKTDLVKLASTFGLATDGLTVEQLKITLRPLVASGAPMPQSGTSVTGGGNVSQPSAPSEGSWSLADAPNLQLNRLLADAIARAVNQAAAGASPERANELVQQALGMTTEPELQRRRSARVDAYMGDESGAVPMETTEINPQGPHPNPSLDPRPCPQ